MSREVIRAEIEAQTPEIEVERLTVDEIERLDVGDASRRFRITAAIGIDDDVEAVALRPAQRRLRVEFVVAAVVRGRALPAFSYSAFGGEFPPGVAERAAHSVDQRILGLSAPATD